MNNQIYTNYYKNHTWYNKSKEKNDFKEINSKIWKYIKNYNKNINILEIWSGQWKFTWYCQKLWFKNYIGFDLDENIVEKCEKKYPKYNFSTEDIYAFLEKKKKKYDLIFMSHVFEHIDDDHSWKLIKLIYWSLKKWWVWINIMPNAGSLFMSNFAMYTDITHKRIYSSNSFNQLLLNNWIIKENILHKNIYYNRRKINSSITKIISRLLKILLEISWYWTDKIHTFEILTIIKK